MNDMTRFARATSCFAALAVALCAPAHGQILALTAVAPEPPQPAPPPPELLPGGRTAAPCMPQVVRWTENWTCLADPATRAALPLERTRYIPFPGEGKDAYLSIGGEVREYYNQFGHAALGARPNDDNSYLQQRLRLFADLHLGPIFRAFVELGDNREFGAEAITPPNRDHFDIEQAFVDVMIPLGDNTQLTLRPGRFEMPLGSGKLVGLREGVDSRYIFQGAQAVISKPGKYSLDLFATKPIEIRPGSMDDRAQNGRHLNGAYLSTGRSLLIPGVSLDAYYFDTARANARFTTGLNNEERKTLGARAYGRSGHWDFDVEGTYQFGTWGADKIRAWGVLMETGYSFPQVAMTPRLGLRANAFSGDHDPTDGKLGTYVAPAMKGPLFTNGDPAWFSFSNIVDVFPMLTLKPTRRVTLIVGPDLFWRQSTSDAIYAGNSLAPLITPRGNSFVGVSYNIDASWQATRNLAFRFFYDRLNVSDAFKAGGGKSGDFLGLQANLRL